MADLSFRYKTFFSTLRKWEFRSRFADSKNRANYTYTGPLSSEDVQQTAKRGDSGPNSLF